MDTSEEKFFEQLAKGTLNGGEHEADLAKATTVSRRAGRKAAEREVAEQDTSDITSEAEGQLTIDVYQTPDHIIVESAIAGVKPEDIDVQVTSDSVTIRGERRREQKMSDENYLYQECYWGRFSRSIILPQEVDADRATVTLKNGILTVKLPKLNRQRAKKLKIKIE